MRSIISNLTGVILFFLLYTSCEKTVLEPSINTSADYYSISVGRWIEYSIEHIVIDVRTNYYDTARYNLKETVTQIISENDSETVYLVERDIRTSANEFWQPYDAIQIVKYPSRVIRTVDNIDEYIMPRIIVKGDIWNGNAYNIQDSVAYSILNTDITTEQNSLIFDSVIHIQHENFTSLINIENSYELYAPGVGMLYSQSIEAESQKVTIGSSGEPVPVLDRVETGTFFYKSIVDYGFNETH